MKNIGKAWFYVGEGRQGLSESFSMSSSLRFFFLLFGSKAGSSAGARLWGFAESLPSNGEHLLPCFLATHSRDMCMEGGRKGGISRMEQAAVKK